jgi:poly(ADP-ribose) glycohydrolase ARH3
MLGKFRGAMVGAVVGDCFGSPIESRFWKGIDFKLVVEHVEAYVKDGEDLEYTDDTAMARQLARTIIEKKGIDSKCLAEKFTEEFFAEPDRGYGANVVTVFKELAESHYSDPIGPAKRQFNGSGSYGNGAAMRVHPVSLFCCNEDSDVVAKSAFDSSLVTHSHPDAVNGAILQAYAVHLALHDTQPPEVFLDRLEELAISKFGEDEKKEGYVSALKTIRKCLKEKDDEAAKDLGNDVSALRSVPSAIYSYLRAQSAVEGLDAESAFVRTMQLAFSFGGDTDTIGSMACAIAGAALGEEGVPDRLSARCEGVVEARKMADEIHEIVFETEAAPPKKKTKL